MTTSMGHPGEDATLPWLEPAADDASHDTMAEEAIDEAAAADDAEETPANRITVSPAPVVADTPDWAARNSPSGGENDSPSEGMTDSDIPDDVADVLARLEEDAPAASASATTTALQEDADVPATTLAHGAFVGTHPLAHVGLAGHTLCLVIRLVYPTGGDEPLAYLSASVDHQLPQSAAPLAAAQVETLPPDLVALGQAAITRFTTPRPTQVSPSPRAKTGKAAAPAPKTIPAPPAAAVPAGPRPAPPPPLAAAETKQAQQLDLFAVATPTPHK